MFMLEEVGVSRDWIYLGGELEGCTKVGYSKRVYLSVVRHIQKLSE